MCGQWCLYFNHFFFQTGYAHFPRHDFCFPWIDPENRQAMDEALAEFNSTEASTGVGRDELIEIELAWWRPVMFVGF